MIKSLKLNTPKEMEILSALSVKVNALNDVSDIITEFISRAEKEVLLIIDEYHKNGINQLCEYLEINKVDRGFLLIFNFNNNKEYKQ